MEYRGILWNPWSFHGTTWYLFPWKIHAVFHTKSRVVPMKNFTFISPWNPIGYETGTPVFCRTAHYCTVLYSMQPGTAVAQSASITYGVTAIDTIHTLSVSTSVQLANYFFGRVWAVNTCHSERFRSEFSRKGATQMSCLQLQLFFSTAKWAAISNFVRLRVVYRCRWLNDHVVRARDYVPMTSIRTVTSMVPC